MMSSAGTEKSVILAGAQCAGWDCKMGKHREMIKAPTKRRLAPGGRGGSLQHSAAAQGQRHRAIGLLTWPTNGVRRPGVVNEGAVGVAARTATCVDAACYSRGPLCAPECFWVAYCTAAMGMRWARAHRPHGRLRHRRGIVPRYNAHNAIAQVGRHCPGPPLPGVTSPPPPARRRRPCCLITTHLARLLSRLSAP